jgi:hypothetical protein
VSWCGWRGCALKSSGRNGATLLPPSVFEYHRLLLANTDGPQAQVGQTTGDGAKFSEQDVRGRGVAVVGRLAGHEQGLCGDI